MKSRKVLLYFILMFSLLTACGSDSGGATKDNNVGTEAGSGEEVAVITQYGLRDMVSLDEIGINNINGLQMTDDGLYAGVYTYAEDTHTILLNLRLVTYEGEALHTTELSVDLEQALSSAFWYSYASVSWYVDTAGEIYVVTILQDERQRRELGLLSKFAADGTLLSEAPITGTPETYHTAAGMAADRDGYFFLLSSSGEYDNTDRSILIFDSEGRFQKIADIESGAPYALVTGKDGAVYAAVTNNMGNPTLNRLNGSTGRVAEVYTDFPGYEGSIICADTEGSFIVSNSNSLWVYTLQTNESVKLFNWLDHNVIAGQVRWIHSNGAGNLNALYLEYSPYAINLLQFVPSSMLASSESNTGIPKEDDPNEVVLAVLWESTGLQNLVQHFNQSHPEYHVVIESYLDLYANNDYDEIMSARDRIQIQLATGTNTFDLVGLTNLDVESLVSAGVFENLYTYLDNSENLGREDIFEGVLSSYTYGGTLVAIPPTFSIDCLVGKKSLLGDRTEWNLREMVDFANAHPDQRLLSSKQYLFTYYTLSRGTGGFMTMDGDTLTFDTKLCADYLELLKRHPDIEPERALPYRLQDEEVLLSSANISSFEEVQLYRAFFDDEPITYIGYPTADKANGMNYTSSEITPLMSICQNSNAKEAAWAFLEYYLLEEPSYGFPSIKKYFDEYAEDYLYNQWQRDKDGELILFRNRPQLVRTRSYMDEDWTFHYREVTEEDIELVQELLSRGGHGKSGSSGVFHQIFDEESAPYLLGQKSLKDSVNAMESRMMIYYWETYQ